MVNIIEKEMALNDGIIKDIRPIITNCALDTICGNPSIVFSMIIDFLLQRDGNGSDCERTDRFGLRLCALN